MPEKYVRRILLFSSAALVSMGLISLIADRSLSETTRESLPPETATTHVAMTKPETPTPESPRPENVPTQAAHAKDKQSAAPAEHVDVGPVAPPESPPESPVDDVHKAETQLDSAVLQESDWYAQAMDYIQKDQYKIRKTRDGDAAWYRAYNPAQNLIAEFGPDGVTLKPYPKREYDERDPRELRRKGFKPPKSSTVQPANQGTTSPGPDLQSPDSGLKTRYALISVGDTTFENISANDYTIDEETGIITLVHHGVTQTWENTTEGIWHRTVIAQAPQDGTLTLRETRAAKSDATRVGDTKIIDALGIAVPYTERKSESAIEQILNSEASVFPLTMEKTLVGVGNPMGLDGEQVDSSFGVAVACAGDVNGDGYSDMVIGAPGFNGEAGLLSGKTYVYTGSNGGLGRIPAWTKEGEQSYSQFGASVDNAGDVNGDGYDDVIVGAPNPNAGFGNRTSKAYVYLGSKSGLSLSAAWTQEGEKADSSFGSSVAGAGDVNGDGYEDVIVGTPTASAGSRNRAGKSYNYLGSAIGLSLVPAWTQEGEQEDSGFGSSVASAGDVNGDGYGDVIIGAPAAYFDGVARTGSRAYVYLGSETGLSLNSSWSQEGEHEDSGFGYSVASAGDVDGDGYSDVVIGAPFLLGSSGFWSGKTYLYLGGDTGLSLSTAWTQEGEQEDSGFGSSVASAGDVNGDSYDDLIVGAPYFDGVAGYSSGKTYLYSGSVDGLELTPTWSQEGEDWVSNFGAPLASAGDLNGDGYSDVIIGAPSFGVTAGNRAGKAYVYFGNAGGLSATSPWVQRDLESDISVSNAGDVNGDGYGDVVIGLPSFDKAYAYMGSEGGLSTYPAWESDGVEYSQFGFSIASAGDVNGDGYDDIAVGSPIFVASGLSTLDGESSAGIWTLVVGKQFMGDTGDDIGILNSWTLEFAGIGHFSSSAIPIPIPETGFFSEIEVYEDFNITDLNVPVDIVLGTSGHFYVSLISPGGKEVVLQSGTENSEEVIQKTFDDEGEDPPDSFRAWKGASVYLGGADGLGDSPTWSVAGEQEYSYFGYSLAGAGDVNGDGYDDIIVGAAGFTRGTEGEYSGKAYVYLGETDGLATSPAWAQEGEQDGSQFGYSLASAGDVNGDGYDDVIVGAAGFTRGAEGEYSGKAYVYLGGADGLATTPAWAQEGEQRFSTFGLSVASAGDVNNDGYADIVIGADSVSEEFGKVYLYLGSSEGLRLIPTWVQNGKQKGSAFGHSVAGAGDVNADGYSDVLIGAPYIDSGAGPESGEVHLYLGSSDGLGVVPAWVQNGERRFFPFGGSVSTAGDVNGDGYGDVVIGGYTAAYVGSGGAYLYYGSAISIQAPSSPRIAIDVPGRRLEELQCTVETPSISPLAGGVLYRYHWNNLTTGEAVVDGPTSALFSVLPVERKRKHDIWVCYVQAWNGHAYSQPRQETDAVEILNSNPSAPAVSLPALQSTSANLVCILLEPGLDDDLDSVQYDYDWYVQRENEATASLFLDGAPTFAISDQINNTDTEPGDQWYCVVTPHDGEAYGEPATSTTATIVLGGVEASFIALALSPPSVTLGESITASGNIFPTPLGSTNATFESISPSGVTSGIFPQGTVISGGAYAQTFVPTEASGSREPWSITASWPGDDTYQAATSAPATFTVAKAQPELALSVSPDTALLGLANTENLAVTATLSVIDFPLQLRGLLEGRNIEVSVVDDDNVPQGELTALTNAAGDAVFTKADFDTAGIDFGTPGVWRFKAVFAGDDNFLSTESADFDDTDARLTIKRGAGYAIVVLGRLDADAEGHREHALTTDFIYRTLLERQFDAGDIYYLREFLPELGEAPAEDVDVFGAATEANLAAALNEVRGKMLESPAPLFVVLVDHGNPDLFYMDDASTPGIQEALTPGALDEQLDLLQAAFLENDEAAAQDIVVINGSCYSGSFIPALSGENRLLITSTTADTISYRGVDRTPDDGANIRDGEFFLMELFRDLGEGRTIADAYERAAQQTLAYTAPSANGGAASGRVQEALLDDNGDGAGTHGTLSATTGLDGARATALTLGLGTNAATGVSWFTASQSITINAGKALDTGLFAQSVGRPLAEGDRAWLEVKRPDAIDELASEAYPDLQRAWSLVGPIDPVEALGDESGRVEWSAAALNAAAGFDVPGTYRAYYFLYDGEAGQVASYLVTNIYVEKSGNQPPASVTPLAPDADAEINTAGSALYFAWEPTSDPEGDAFTYTIEVSADSAFPEGLTALASGLESTVVGYDRDFREARGIPEPPEGDYFWRVYAVDAFGAESPVDEVRRFTLRNVTNPSAASAVAGQVVDARSSLPIQGAEVELDGITSSTGSQGEFIFLQLASGTPYELSATAPGYTASSGIDLEIDSGKVLKVQVDMTRVSATAQDLAELLLGEFAGADNDNSDGLDLSEARTILAGLGAQEFAALDTNSDGELSLAELEVVAGEGEGEVEGEGEGNNNGGCPPSGKGLIKNITDAAGDLFLFALALAALAGWRGFARRQ